MWISICVDGTRFATDSPTFAIFADLSQFIAVLSQRDCCRILYNNDQLQCIGNISVLLTT